MISERATVDDGGLTQPGMLEGSYTVLGRGAFHCRTVKAATCRLVPHLVDFTKRRGQTSRFSQGWMPEPIDTVTVECICKNSLNSSLSKSYMHKALWT